MPRVGWCAPLLADPEVIEAWTMRKASLASRLADTANAADDRAAEASHSQRVVDCMEEMLASCTNGQRQQEIIQQRSFTKQRSALQNPN